MKTEHELTKNILDITMKIKDNYPELSNFIVEMPITIPNSNDPEINLKNLQEYYNSLYELLNKYDLEHGAKISK